MVYALREIKKKTEQFFLTKGIPSPKLDADLLLAHVLRINRLDLYLDLDRPLTKAEVDELRNYVRRRGQREPIQYILGVSNFYNCNLMIDSRALIPRQETEYLIELLLPRLTKVKKILELGTGSGALALALIKELNQLNINAHITALDNDENCLELSRLNQEKLKLKGQVEFIKSDWFSAISEGNQYDLILSNPPYLSQDLYKIAEPEVKDYEPKQALVALDHGMADLKVIINEAYDYLNPNGFLALETGTEQHIELIKFAENAGFKKVESIKDLNKCDRFLFLHR